MEIQQLNDQIREVNGNYESFKMQNKQHQSSVGQMQDNFQRL